MPKRDKNSECNRKYRDKLAFLVRRFDDERRERFFPFYLIFGGEKEHSRFDEALSIGKYFLDHAVLNSDEDAVFYETLKKLVEEYRTADIDYWKFAKKTPIPMQDYLKVTYDLRTFS